MMSKHFGTVVYGNKDAYNDRNLTPTVIVQPAPSSSVMTQEIFGPILPIVTSISIEGTIHFVQVREKPLAIYYFGKNSDSNENLLKIKTELTSGALVINDCYLQTLNPELPFGGVGGSGFGRLQGKAGFNEFSNTKSVFAKPSNSWLASLDLVMPPFTLDRQEWYYFV